YSPLNVGGDDSSDSDADPAMDGMTETTTLESGDNDDTLDAGIYEPASLGDYVWEDLNANGIQDDGDTGVEGVTVNLKDEAGEVIQTTTTDADGAYEFTDLDPGTYSVQFELPSGFTFSPIDQGGDDATDSDANPTMDGMTATTTLESGDNDPTLDAGIYQTTSLGDYVWNDLNFNGIQDDGDTGVGGVTVNLKDESGNVIETTTTADDGSYSFDDLIPGTYSVQFVLPEGFVFSPVNAGDDDSIDSDADPAMDGMTATTTLESGDSDPTLDAGINKQIDLQLIKSVSNATPNVGDVITFTIDVENLGPNNATGVAVEDVVPNGYSNIDNISDGGTADGNTITWDGLTIANGSTISLTFDVTVNEPGDDIDYVNIAEVTAADQIDSDSEPGNGADTDGDGDIGPLDNDGSQDNDDEDDGDDARIAPQQIDLQLVKSVSDAAPNVGDIITFSIAVENLGPDDATGVGVEDIVPNGYSSIGNISNSGTIDGNTVTWGGLAIEAGASITLTFDAMVNEPGEGVDYVNLAEVSEADQDDIDSTPGNGADTDEDGDIGPLDDDGSQDSDDEDDGDDARITPQQIDLELIKTVSDATPNVGDVITFTIQVDNLGPDDATNVAIEDVVPNGYSAISNISNGGQLDGNIITWSGFTIADGGSISLSFDAIVNEPGDGISYFNVAQVTDADQDDVDSTPDNDDGDQSEDDEDNAEVGPQQIDLELTKTVSDATPNVGDVVTFTIQVDNLGPDAATNVAVEDVVPNGYSNITNISNDGVLADNVITWSGLNIANDGSITLTFDAVVNEPAEDISYFNVAQVTAADQDDVDSTPNNDDGDQSEDDEDNAEVGPQQIDLELTKTVNDETPNVGDVVTFTIQVDNLGPDDATNVAIEDVVPNGYSSITNISDGGSLDGNTITWSGLSIAVDGSISLTFEATVNEPAAGISYFNVAQVTAADQDDVDSTPDNDDGDQSEDDEDNAEVGPQQIDLELTKSVSDETPNVGDEVTFTIDVQNLGPNAATNVAIEDIIPNGYSNISNISDGGNLADNTITWSGFDIGVGESISLTFTAEVNEPAEDIDYLNVAQVTEADQDDVDSTPDNDDGDQSEDDEDNAGVDPVQIDLELDKSVDNRNPLVGSTVVFTIDLVNQGPDEATGITVFDPIPSGYSDAQLVSFDGTAFITPSGRSLVWRIPSLAAGESVSVSFSATVNAVGNYTNLAQVTRVNEDDVDSTPDNGVDTDNDGEVDDDDGDEDDGDGVEVDPIPVIDLELDKSINNATPDVGSNVIFTISVINQGPSDGTGIVVTDKLPSGYSFVTSSTGSDYNASTGDWDLGDLAVGETKTLEIVATVLASGNYQNLAEVTDANEEDIDSTPDNGVDTDNDGDVEDDDGDEDDGDGVEVDPNPIADLALDKSVNVEFADGGDIIEFTVALTNQGPSTGTGIVVGDQLESGFTFQSATATQGSYDETTGEWTVGTLVTGQTEFLYITVQVNNQGEYFNLAEVIAANEDDVDSTPDNGVDTDNDGEFEDDFGDEDDGDGVVVDVDCDLTGEIVAVRCDDNGTPFDPTDDIFYADLSITGFGVGTSIGWMATVAGEVVGSGDYSGGITTVGPFAISEGDVLIYAIDADDSGCRAILRADAPEPCSLLPCDLEAELTSVDCDDNGTASDPSDDVYYVSFNVIGSNNESWSATVDGEIVLSNEHYNQNVTLGPFAISEGPIELVVSDDDVPDCGASFTVTPPAACSEECQVSVSLINEPECDDNGTPGDPSDDTFSFSLFIQGNNTSASTWTNNFGETGNFGELVTYGPYLISDGPVSFTFADEGNNLCRESITVDPPSTCSDQCDLTLNLGNVLCDDNGTPANPNDDVYTFTLEVNGLNAGNNGWAAVINNSVVEAGEYGETVTFGPYNIVNGPIQVNVHDVDDASCSKSVIVTPPSSCSEACSVVVSQAEAPVCNDNGTAGDPNDDLFFVKLEINGTNGSNSWNAYVDGQLIESGSYGTTREFGPFSIADGPITIQVEDAVDGECADEITIIPPTSCSEECSITANLLNTICDDKGTPYDPSDDTYLAIVQVTGNNTGANWSSPELFPQFASYGATVILGPYSISGGNRVVDFYDLGDPSCTTSLFIEAPDHCSDACLIDAVVMDVVCQDQGTADPSDDTFTFELTVSGQFNFGTGWRTVGTDPVVNGQYGESYTFGPYLISEGAVELKIADAQDITCSVEIDVAPPATCSSPDCEVVTNVLDVICDDAGTPTDPSDDTYTVEMSIDVVNSSTAAAWTASTGDGAFLGTGLFGSTASFGPFAIADGAVEIVVADLADASCSTSNTIEAPATCSEGCEIIATASNVECDDLNTADASDDTYGFDLLVTGTNVSGSGWMASSNGVNLAVGTYGQITRIEGLLITDGDVTLTITDLDDQDCGSATITVEAPEACSETDCTIGAITIVDGPVCDSDNTYSFTVLVEGDGDGWVSQDGSISGAFNEPVVVSGQPADGEIQKFIIDQVGVEGCTEEFEVQAPTAGQCSLCDLTANITDIICDDNGTMDPTDDTFTFALTVTDGELENTGWTSTDNEGFTGTFAEPKVFGPFSIQDGNINFILASDLNPNCELAVFIPVPTTCSAVCEITPEIAEVICNDAGTPDTSEDDMFIVNVSVTGNEMASMGWMAESLDGQSLGAGAYGTVGMFGPFNTVDGEVSIVFVDMMTGDCRDTLTIDPAQYCSAMIVECPESNYYCPILEENTYMIPTDPYDCVATAELPLPVVTLEGCDEGYQVLTELIDEAGNVIATIQNGEDRVVPGLAIGNYTLRYLVVDNCDAAEKELECLLQVLDKEYPTAICVGDINVSIGSQGGARLLATQIDFGSYDNCGIASIEVRRKSMTDPASCETLDEPVMSDWGEYVEFTCCDANTYVTVELLVTDVSGNQNTCWLDVLVEDKIKPVVFGLEDMAVDCDELPSDFDPQDSTHLVTLFGEARVFDNCEAQVIEMDPILDISDCGSGTITRRFKAIDQVGNESIEVFTQVISLSYSLNYEIEFPEDVETDCMFNAKGLELNKLGCDSLTVTYVDEFLPLEGGECANIERTYTVINHCEWDGQTDPVIISRDEDCDNLEGNEGVFVIVRADGAFIDRDNDETNTLPLAGTKGDNCDNTTNPEGYWRAVVSTGSWQYTQRIKVFDTTAPVIEFTEPDPVCTEELDCEPVVSYPFTVTESCLTDQLQFTLELDAFADGTIDADLSDQNLISGTYPDYVITGSFPVGNHQFELTVQDLCGNVSNVSMPFSVVDCYVPDPNCFDGFEAVLEALDNPTDVDGDGIVDEAAVTVFAAELASCNVEDCSAPLRFSVNRVGEVANVDQTTLTLTCEDRYRITVEVYVWDSAFNPYAVQPDGTVGGPNYKYCTAEVILRDPNEVCNDCEDDLLLEGNVMTEGEQTVEEVSIILEGPIPANTSTVSDGNFEFIGMEANGTYTLRPFKDGDDRNGITTLDVLLIQAHLLGANTLDTPYKLIAADVNNSGTITAADVLELRALLLEETNAFASNTSWRFVDSQFEFPQATNPWATEFPEFITTMDLTSCQFDLDFVAVKIGDVNGTAKANRLMTLEDRSSNGTMGFELKDQYLQSGKRYTVDFKTTDLAKVQGYQFALVFDPAALELEEVQYGIAQAEHFGLSQAEQGMLLTSWNHESLSPTSAITNAEKPIVFSLVFTAKENGYLRDQLEISTRGLMAEAYDLSKDKVEVDLGFDTGIFLAKEPVLYQNFPNPFRDQTLISFDLPTEANVRLDVQDLQGRVVESIGGQYGPGQHTVELSGEKVPLGVLYYSLQVDGEYVKTKKMIRIE
ncbi:MAG: DUF11 domain-containing protein, partial [Saprospiraceae bacterium]|nr:DUF11 domain-containing protein [Saprospiraceae bacterium]